VRLIPAKLNQEPQILGGLCSTAQLKNAKRDSAMREIKRIKHVYEVHRRKDHRGFDLISDLLPFGRLWYDTPDNAIG
jgi:hypothetical protein